MKTVLVTGGSSGIGKACVERFARDGFDVWFTYRSGKERAEKLVEELKKCGTASVRSFHFDQGDYKSQQALLKELPGPVDILINNAGLGSATVENYKTETHLQDQELLQVNATGVLWLTQALLPQMKQKNAGKIVFVSSVGGGITQFPSFRLADGMSKAAVSFLAKQLAAELASSGVDVFAVCPGATETAMFEKSTLSKMGDQERKEFVEGLPKGRLIQPEEVADLIRFLCKDEAKILHGAVLDASLGLGVHPGLVTGRK
jgi:NAD(P)-dependent dehydrogenase (short-subunit alcohol dehydrogenase family)